MIAKRLFSVILIFTFSISVFADNAKTALTELLAHHQKMIVLLSDSEELDPLDQHVHTARNFYSLKHQQMDALLHLAEEQAETTDNRHLLPVTQTFLEFYRDAQMHDADRLAFADLGEELLLLEQERNIPSQGLVGLRQVNADIQRFSDYFREEYKRTLSKLGKSRGAREDWQAYLKLLHQRYNSQQLIQQIEEKPELYKEKTRGKNLAKNKKDQLAAKMPKVVWGNGMPEKTVALTFDDGPHRLRTGKILDTLKKYGVKGYFFAVGRNLGKAGDTPVISKRNAKVIKRITDEGHILANHSFNHKELTKLDEDVQKQELEQTNQLIKTSTGFENILFRPPYGSKNKALEDVVSEEGLSSIMWNIDSMDWADPIPESIAERTFEILDKKKKGILLFHDIHKQTVNALPLILEGLAKRGYKVTTLDGTPFTLGESGVPKLPTAKKPKLYDNSWAVVIGVNKYKHWPKLDYAVADAKSIADKLHQNFGFKKENIIEIYDEQANRHNIAEVLGYTLADPKKVKKNDRVFIFYAGHGATRGLPNGKNLGYLIPSDAELEKYPTNSISMSQLNDYSALIPAKHVYFVMDSCYSGLALTRSGKASQQYNYLEHVTNRQARQIITAGGADQEVADGGPNGHSVFTWAFLQALDGKADTDDNGYITASEIGTYVSPVVASYAPQTPAFGNLIGNAGGDFVFELNQQAQQRRQQLQQQAKVQQVAALAAKENNMEANVGRQLDLDKSQASEKVVATTDLDKQMKDTARARAAYKVDAEALKLFRAGKLEDAEKKWAEAVKLNPFNENIVNNYGFVLDKLNRNEEALIWYYRTVELAPRRTPVYLNLGDIMVKLGKPELAIPYYERYLHLYPSYKKAEELEAKIKKLTKN